LLSTCCGGVNGGVRGKRCGHPGQQIRRGSKINGKINSVNERNGFSLLNKFEITASNIRKLNQLL
jgi:hypothetical protein